MFPSVFIRLILATALALVAVGLGLWRQPVPLGPQLPGAAWPGADQAAAGIPGTAADATPNVRTASLGGWHLEARGSIPMPEATLAAHASNLLAMPPAHPALLTAFWFAGDRESAPNVQIAASQWDRASQAWLPARFVVNRHILAQQLGFGVRRLGNPVAWLDGDGRMQLFVVATGWGGWAASRIVQLRQSGPSSSLPDLVFEPVRVLPLSWLWNISYLVRNAPLIAEDAGMVLPVHFELGLKHASVLRFDSGGQFVGLTPVSHQLDRLQPTLVAQSATDWLALMRVQRPDGKIARAQTTDAGAHWRDLPDLSLDNPDAAVAGLGLAPQNMVLAYNPSTQGRTALDLATSNNGQQWALLAKLAQGGPGSEFSYPALAFADGKLWVSYTVDRTHLEWQRFGIKMAAP